jgi:tetratricopeptide (TPR) repeat protein
MKQNRSPRTAMIATGVLALVAASVGFGMAAGLGSGESDRNRGPVASYLSGRVAQSAGDWGRAARLVTDALRADPGNAALVRRAFLLHLGDGHYAEATDLARKLVELGQDSFIASALIVADDMAEGRTKAALEHAAALPEEGLGRYAGPLVAAWAHVAAGDSAQALKILAPVGDASGFSPLQQLETGLIEDLNGNPAEAAKWFAKVTETGAPLRVVQLVGNFYERTGRTDEARQLYQRYLAASQNNPAIEPSLQRLARGEVPKRLIANPKEGLAEILFDLGAALHQENASEMALLYGRVSLRLKADQPLALLLVGDILAARDRTADALKIYSGIKADPGVQWTARLRQADMLRDLQKTDEARRLLEAMAKDRPERTDALLRLGDLSRIDNKPGEAVTAYDRAIARMTAQGPNDWVVFYARGMALDQSKRWPEAERDLQKALELSPDQPSVLNYLGYSWIEHGERLDEGRRMIEKAVRLRPNDGYILDSLGWAKYRLGDVEGAMRDLERAVEMKPLDPAINDHLGDVYWAAGQHTLARFQWTRAGQQAEEPALKEAVAEKLKREIPVRRTAETRPEAQPSTEAR